LLAIVPSGAATGFPLLTGLALQHIPPRTLSFHRPSTAGDREFGELRGGERPKRAFWLFSITGSVAVAGFALTQSGSASVVGDLLMVAAILLCGLGYAEGASCPGGLAASGRGCEIFEWTVVNMRP
jgi:hypothetical protein